MSGLYVLLLASYCDVSCLTPCILWQVRGLGWLFPLVPSSHWYDTWAPFRMGEVDWLALLQQWPTIASLALFTLILVPIRIPSLALITGELWRIIFIRIEALI